DEEAARRLAEEAVSLLHERDDPRRMLRPLGVLSEVLRRQGDLAGAQHACRERLAVARRLGSRSNEASTLGDVGVLAMQTGDFDEAGRMLEASAVMSKEVGFRGAEGDAQAMLGRLWRLRGNLPQAERADEAALAIY